MIIVSCFIRNRKYQQHLIVASLLLLLIFSNTFLLNQFAKFWDVAPDQSKTTTKYSCAIVLGGFVSEDNNKKGFLNWAADRFIQGIKLKETGKVTHLLFTGGSASLNPDGFTEGNWISSELKAFHFPDSTLLFEKRARNTIENIQFSKIILQSRHLPPPYLLVTSAFHMRRALLICKKYGVKVVPYPCNFFAGKGSTSVDHFIPSAETLANWNIYLKELVGYAVTFIKSRL
ncbi:MAG: YdcF family protein [Janthinobacterium lividum]